MCRRIEIQDEEFKTMRVRELKLRTHSCVTLGVAPGRFLGVEATLLTSHLTSIPADLASQEEADVGLRHSTRAIEFRGSWKMKIGDGQDPLGRRC